MSGHGTCGVLGVATQPSLVRQATLEPLANRSGIAGAAKTMDCLLDTWVCKENDRRE